MGSAGKTVLVVEDDADIREIVCDALSIASYRVLAAPDGETALAILDEEAEPPDVIVLDWMLPAMSGGDVIERLANDPRRAQVPVLVISAVDRAFKLPQQPVAVVLQKPVRMKTLVEVIDRLAGMPWRPVPFRTGTFPVIRVPVTGSPTMLMRPKPRT